MDELAYMGASVISRDVIYIVKKNRNFFHIPLVGKLQIF